MLLLINCCAVSLIFFLPYGTVDLAEFSIPKFHSVYCMLLHVSHIQIKWYYKQQIYTFCLSDHDQSSICKV